MNIKKIIALIFIILLSKSTLSIEIKKIINHKEATTDESTMNIVDYLNTEDNNFIKNLLSVKTLNKKQLNYCVYCKKTLKSKTSLKKHFIRFHPEKLFNCNECNKTYLDKSSLISHQKIHINELSKCNKCNERFNSELILEEHIKNKHN